MIAEFEKKGRMVWFSHLDLQSTMQRALRRAELPVRFSQGFNPHVELAFATALSVGAESLCELMDVELAEEVAPADFLMRLNACLPEGLQVRRARLAQEGEPALAARLAEAEYAVCVPGRDLRAAAADFLAAPAVVVEKRSKKGVKPVDIRPLVHALRCAFDGADSRLEMILEQTNAQSLKAELLLETLCAGARCACARTALYARGAFGRRVELFEAAK